MVSISDKNPEIRRQADGQQSSASTPTPAQNGNGAGIFKVGLTQAEASTNTQLNSLFTKYYSDGDDVISQFEFDAYTKDISNQQQDITSASGKRTAVGGIYTIQAGDSLSKIAKDFGIPLLDLYNANVDVIGKSVNSTIHPGQQLKISKSQGGNKAGSVSQANPITKAERKEKMKNLLKAMGIDTENADTQEILNEFKQLPKEERKKFFQQAMEQYIDFEKVDNSYADKSLDEIVQMLNIDSEQWANANTAQKGEILAQSMNAKFKADIDPENKDSVYNKELQRLKTQGPTDKEREMYGSKFDFNNLSEKDYENLAKLSVAQSYAATVITIAHEKFHNEQDTDFSVLAQSYMRSLFKSDIEGGNNIDNIFVFLAGTRKITNDDLRATLNTYAEMHKSDGTEDSLAQKLAFHIVMENVDAEHIKMLYQNNASEIESLNEVAKTVADNTTDSSRKAMLNDIVENSASIIQGSNNSSPTKNSDSGSGSSPTISSNLSMTNPIQNSAQINYVNNLRQASEAYQSQKQDSDNAIPQEYRQAFTTVKEYVDFKGTGLTMAEYQREKSAIKNNFTSAMNELVENYTNIPDKFKPRILAFFDSMDNNTSGELYLGANDKVRHFMDKYNYMNNQKLLQYVQNHPAEVNEAPRIVQQMIRDLQQEQEVHS